MAGANKWQNDTTEVVMDIKLNHTKHADSSTR